MPARDRITWLWRGRRFAEEVAAIDADLAAPTDAPSDVDRFNSQRERCLALRRLGRDEAAAEAARAVLELVEKLQPQPEVDPSIRDFRRAWAYTCAGGSDEAIATMRHSIEVLPEPSRASDRWSREAALARIYALFGRKRECVELLAKLLRVPSGITVPTLRVVPHWDNVREDAAFKALLADPKNSAPL